MNKLINSKIHWQAYNNIILDKNCTHVFKTSINVYEKIKYQYLEILSDEEIEKAISFRQKDDMKRYIIGKFFLRIILSRMLSKKPSAIIFLYTKNKKSYVIEQQFNISHSGEFIVIAMSPLPVGIDIEFINKDFDFHPLLKECFIHSELQYINNRFDFYTFWTRKEAILKASGEGLIDNLHSVNCSESIVFRNNSNFKLVSNHIDNNYIISLATNSLYSEYEYWDLEV